jgi:sulfur-oxidizing protein SoxA
MKTIITLSGAVLAAAIMVGCQSTGNGGSSYQAMVDQDVKQFQDYFASRFPDTEFDDYQNGVYAIDAPAREQWESIEEFPPYELDVDDGKVLFETPFANGKTYADCFENGGIGVRQNYPYFDEKRGEVVTLELAINECREANGEKPLGWKKGAIAQISAYMAWTSRGKPVDVKVGSKAAYDAYMDGKKSFYTKHGQLNLSCADCHMRVSGQLLRADLPSPALGHVTHFPVYRSKWNALGTLHRRYGGCHENIRAKAFPAQGPEYRNLEYFQTVMSNGLEFNGPGARK